MQGSASCSLSAALLLGCHRHRGGRQARRHQGARQTSGWQQRDFAAVLLARRTARSSATTSTSPRKSPSGSASPMEFVSDHQFRAHPGAAAGSRRPRRFRHDARRQPPASDRASASPTWSRRTPSSSARTPASPRSSRWPERSSRWCKRRERRRRTQGGRADHGYRLLRHLCALLRRAAREEGRGLSGRRGAAMGLCTEERRRRRTI